MDVQATLVIWAARRDTQVTTSATETGSRRNTRMSTAHLNGGITITVSMDAQVVLVTRVRHLTVKTQTGV